MEINVGISSCLLGNKVRYDGSHKLEISIRDILGKKFNLIAVCPEEEIGMGIPREKVDLYGSVKKPYMIGDETGIDWTAKMNRYSKQKLKCLKEIKLRGFILKKNSPSCGMEKVKLYNEKGKIQKKARGLFANCLIKNLPLMPVEEEGNLNNIKQMNNFVIRVFAYDNLCNLFDNRFKRSEVIKFHLTNKYLITSHSLKHYKMLDQLVFNIKDIKPNKFRIQYSTLFMDALRVSKSL